MTAYKPFNLLHCTLQARNRISIAYTHIVLSNRAERFARHDGDVFFAQKLIGERLAVHPQRRYARKYVKRAARLERLQSDAIELGL